MKTKSNHLTVEQQGQANQLGIMWRNADDTWGFKRKCANTQCNNVVSDHCYCAEDFEDALEISKDRSIYCCSYKCFEEYATYLDIDIENCGYESDDYECECEL